MSETKKTVKSVKSATVKRGRGRPEKPLELPKTAKWTVNDLVALNPAIECRLTMYNRIRKLLKARKIQKLKETRPTGGVGKPMAVFQRVAVKSAPKATKAPKAPTVDLTPAVTEAVVAEAVTA